MFDTVAEASQKLRHCVILKGGSPIKINDACGNDGFNNVKLQAAEYGEKDSQYKTISCNGANLDFGKELGSRCGYVNLTHKSTYGMVVYTSRMPVRKSHSTQGLSESNVRVTNTKAFKDLKSSHYVFSSLEYIGMRDTLLGKFPSLAQVRYRFGKSDNVFELAFDKNFAVSRDNKDVWKLMYKSQDIGWTDDLTTFHVPREWRYLDETFEELSMKVRT